MSVTGLLLSSEPQARSLYLPRTYMEKGHVSDKNECLYRSEEMRGQMPGATCNGARTKSAISNTQTPGYVRAPEGVARQGIRTEGLGKVRRHCMASHQK